MTLLPLAMTRAPLRAFRPQDLAETYTQPRVQLQRLTRTGRVKKAAPGIYYAIPDDELPGWFPTLEAAAAAVATAMYGDRVPVLMGLTAARLLGAIPRAIGVAVVAVPRQHPPIRLLDRPQGGDLVFVERAVHTLDATVFRTELGPVLATTAEQTVVDLAKRPALGAMADEALAAAGALWVRCDQERARELARGQRALRALDRLVAGVP